jgi:hypothetical protein
MIVVVKHIVHFDNQGMAVTIPLRWGLFWSCVLMMTLHSSGNDSNRWDFQFEGKTSYCAIDSLPLPYHSGPETAGFLYNINTLSNLQLFDSLHFIIIQHLRAAGSDTLFPEQLYPFENYLYGGLEYSGPGKITIGGSNTLFKNPQSFPTPWYPGSSRIKPEMLNSIDGSWDLETERFTTAASASYLMYKFTMQPNNLDLDSELLNSSPYGFQWDNDLWVELTAAFALSDDISLDAGGFTKQDLNTNDGYNLYRAQAGISGNHQLYRNRFRIEWNLLERLTKSTLMDDNGYATGLSTLLLSKLLWRIKSNFYLKGGFRGEFGKELHKIWYEAQLRKTWDNGSNLDIGYTGSTGVLFPRYGLRIGSKLAIHPHFAVAVSLAGYVSRFTSNEYRYYRSDAGLELLFPVVKSKICLEFFCGGNIRHYDHHPLYTSRRMVSAGLRLW